MMGISSTIRCTGAHANCEWSELCKNGIFVLWDKRVLSEDGATPKGSIPSFTSKFSHFSSNAVGRKLSGISSPLATGNGVVRCIPSTSSLKKRSTWLNEAKKWFFVNRTLTLIIHKKKCTCEFDRTSILNLFHVRSWHSTRKSILKCSRWGNVKTNAKIKSSLLYSKRRFSIPNLGFPDWLYLLNFNQWG